MHIPWDFRTITKYTSITSDKKELHFEFNDLDTRADQLADMHFEMELGIVLEGELEREAGDVSHSLQPGDVWLTNIWEPHAYTRHSSPCKVLVIMIHPQLLQEINLGTDLDVHWHAPFVSSPGERPAKLPENVRSRLLLLCRETAEIMNQSDHAYKQIQLRLILLRILSEIKACWSLEAHAPSYLSKYKLISPAMDALYRSREYISTDHAAGLCGLSSSAFNSRFKELMGSSFSQYSLSYRLKGVASQLIHTDDPVKKIVEDWGFTDESHLHRNFTRQFGITPGKYRQQRQSR